MITTSRPPSGYAPVGGGATSMAMAPSAESLASARRSEAAQIADNIIRQRLRIGNAGDPVEVANGLRRLFPREAQVLDAEAAGLPRGTEVSIGPAVRPPASLATDVEIERAETGITNDLYALSTDHRLGDLGDEFHGFRQSILETLADGRSAAALALDPRARDRLFGARRQLGEYSRLFRMIGALNPAIGSSYRRLALNLDDAGSLMLALAGETIAGLSLGGLRSLPSVAASDLQSRRDAVINGLRAIFNCAGGNVACDSFPWSMEGMREFMLRIENSGHLDLRALLDEGTLARHLDGLVELAARNDGPGLRALGATADITTQKLYRLLSMGDKVDPAPALSHFLKALQLFLDTFASSKSGYRLLHIARPAIAQRGRMGFGGPDAPTGKLLRLIHLRAELGGFADCFLACDCKKEDVIYQILLDKVLHDTDRAIDLYILGQDGDARGEAEWRAGGYGCLVGTLPRIAAPNNLQPGQGFFVDGHLPAGVPFRNGTPLGALLGSIEEELVSGKFRAGPAGAAVNPPPTAEQIDSATDELCLQRLTDRRLESVVRTFSTGCVPAEDVLHALEIIVNQAIIRVREAPPAPAPVAPAAPVDACRAPKVKLPRQPAFTIEKISESVEAIAKK